MILKHKEYERTMTGRFDGDANPSPSADPQNRMEQVPISVALRIAVANAGMKGPPRADAGGSFGVEEERDAGSLLMEQNLEAELDKMVVR